MVLHCQGRGVLVLWVFMIRAEAGSLAPGEYFSLLF